MILNHIHQLKILLKINFESFSRFLRCILQSFQRIFKMTQRHFEYFFIPSYVKIRWNLFVDMFKNHNLLVYSRKMELTKIPRTLTFTKTQQTRQVSVERGHAKVCAIKSFSPSKWGQVPRLNRINENDLQPSLGKKERLPSILFDITNVNIISIASSATLKLIKPIQF